MLTYDASNEGIFAAVADTSALALLDANFVASVRAGAAARPMKLQKVAALVSAAWRSSLPIMTAMHDACESCRVALVALQNSQYPQHHSSRQGLLACCSAQQLLGPVLQKLLMGYTCYAESVHDPRHNAHPGASVRLHTREAVPLERCLLARSVRRAALQACYRL